VQSLCAPLRSFRSELKEKFYHKVLPHITPCIVDVHPYKNISLPRYRVPQKTVKFVPVVPNSHGRANVCAHLLNSAILKKMFWGLFIGDDM